MEKVNDETLTRFLIKAMSDVFNAQVERVSKPVIPAKNIRQYMIRDPMLGLSFLETDAGNLYESHTDIRVFMEQDGILDQIWGMQIVAKLFREELSKINIVPTEVLSFLKQTRLNGFALTLEHMEHGEEYSLFDILTRKAPAAVGEHVRPGDLVYTETIDDNLSLFGGDEKIQFKPHQQHHKRRPLFIGYCQGGRI